ncbi:MAG: bifunctional riboflavin kinase/FAD synthetase [Acaryochloridaceae cyanobacterium RU_4_10]|nr:bifunctional riboflavin kinase/FAD synthetase [Acaryochloridaceae cyanobacterium RU_4_10]
MRVISSLENCLQPTQVALGNFDGVHLGHRAVIETLLPAGLNAVASGCSEARGHATVVSFNPHPQVFFSGQSKPLLTVLPEKVELLQALGVEQLVLLPFDRALADLTPEEFVEKILVRQLQAKKISVGFNFCFGRNRSGTVEDLQTIAHQYSIPVRVVPPETIEGTQVSSSEIREALSTGNIHRANRFLGRTYALTGTVVEGQKLGRTLGFPTANLSVSEQKLIPRQGVYRVEVSGPTLTQKQMGVMNIGLRPTVDGTRQTLEVHLLDWSGDLYGNTVTVSLEQFLRPEQKFESLDALKDQIRHDCEQARSQSI